MRRAGKRIYAALDARLWHRGGGASGGEDSPQIRYYHVRNTYIVSARHAPLGGGRALLRHVEILVMNLLSALRSRQRVASIRAVFAGWRDYRRGRLGPRPSSP
jgi:GT2 family glycosyltransferase